MSHVSQPDQSIEGSTTGTPPPTVDISPLLARGDSIRHQEVAARIHRACVESGFLVAVGHGLEAAMDDLFARARSFFDQDQATKELTPRTNRYGFVPHRDHAIDHTRRSGSSEYIDMGLGHEVPMPELPGFESAVRTYQQAALVVANHILAVLARSLGAEPDFFAQRMSDPQCRLRLLHYLPTTPSADGVIPVTTDSHTDYGAITLLATDGVPGLEVKPIGQPWTPVVAPPGSLVVNLGDMMARWSNDRYRSTPHRVVGPIGTDRISIPFFINPNAATVIEPITAVEGEDSPPRYKPVSAGEFLAARIDNAAAGGAEPYVDRRDGPDRTVTSAGGSAGIVGGL